MKALERIALFLLLWPLYAHSEQYLCVPEKITGFAYHPKTKEWDYAKFRPDFKYVIAPAKGNFTFSLAKVGEQHPTGGCKDGFNDAGFLFCEIPDGDFKFNKKNGRYLMVFDMGYYLVGAGNWAEKDEDSGSPAIQIGKCSPF